MSAYRALASLFATWSDWDRIETRLYGDEYARMPPGAAESHGRQLGLVQGSMRALLLGRETRELVKQAKREDLGPWQRANVRDIEERIRFACAVPAHVDRKFSKQRSLTAAAWGRARAAREGTGDFSLVVQELERMVDAAQKRGSVIARCLRLPSHYDGLMHQHAPGRTTADIQRLLIDPLDQLTKLRVRVVRHQAAQEVRALMPKDERKGFDLELQRELARALAKGLGFDPTYGVLAFLKGKAFSTGQWPDCRLFTRIDKDTLRYVLVGTGHEFGHWLYKYQLPRSWSRQPVGYAREHELHESQSLFWDRMILRRREFWEWFAPKLREIFNVSGVAWSAENLYRFFTHVCPGADRPIADCVTYIPHVGFRTELEIELYDGRLRPRDYRDAFNAAMESHIGVTPKNDFEGCLSDPHPYFMPGYIGTYGLGALGAAQFAQALFRKKPELLRGIAASGDFAPARSWLKHRVHRHGRRFSTAEILQQATGSELSIQPFLKHIEDVYLW